MENGHCASETSFFILSHFLLTIFHKSDIEHGYFLASCKDKVSKFSTMLLLGKSWLQITKRKQFNTSPIKTKELSFENNQFYHTQQNLFP